MGFISKWLGIDALHIKLATMEAEKTNERNEILCMLSKLHEAVEQIEPTDLTDSLENVESNLVKVNTMLLEVKGLVSIMRACIPKKVKEQPKKREKK